MIRVIAGSRPAHSGASAGSIEGVGPTKPGLRKGISPVRLPGRPSPFRKSRVGPESTFTPTRILNPYPYSSSEGKVRDVILHR